MESPREEGELSEDEVEVFIVTDEVRADDDRSSYSSRSRRTVVSGYPNRKRTSYRDVNNDYEKYLDPPSPSMKRRRPTPNGNPPDRENDRNERESNQRRNWKKPAPWSTRYHKQHSQTTQSQSNWGRDPIRGVTLPPPNPNFPHGILPTPLLPPTSLPPTPLPDTRPSEVPQPFFPTTNKKRLKRKKKNLAVPNAPSRAHFDIDVPRSPPPNLDESDYVDLLLEYKQIQKQLENIQREEERHIQVDSRESARNVEAEKGAWKGKESDCDLDLMELKWAALASTVKKNKVEGQGGAVVNPKEAARQFMASWDHTAPPSPPRQAQRDNYEEVEMDLASDCEAVDSPGVFEERIPGILEGNQQYSFSPKVIETLDSKTGSPIPTNFEDDLTKYTSLSSGPVKIPGLDFELSPEQQRAQDQVAEDPGEESELLLRERLIASMKKRDAIAEQKALVELEKESEGLSSAPSTQVNSPCATPTSMESPKVSPAHDLPDAPKRSPLANENQKPDVRKSTSAVDLVPLPFHAPLMIDLREESSDEENISKKPNQHLIAGIDAFLRQAKQASQASHENQEDERIVVPRIKASTSVPMSEVQESSTADTEVASDQAKLLKQVQQLEFQVVQKRKSLRNDSEKLSILMTHSKERRGRLRDSLQKVLKLKQQMKAAESIYKANKKTFEELNTKSLEIKTRVVSGKKDVDVLEAKIIQLGTQVYGEKYMLKREKVTAADKIVPQAKNGSLKKPATNVSQMSPAHMAQEKERLIQLQLALKKTIQQIKARGISAACAPPRPPTPEEFPPEPEHVETEETMSFSSKTEEAAKELANFVPKRRISSIELKSSTVPDLLIANSNATSSQVQSTPLSEPEDFVMPSAAKKMELLDNLHKKYSLNTTLLADLAPLNSSFKLSEEIFLPKLSVLPGAKLSTSQTNGNATPITPFTSYTSSLHCFKSYRFSPYYRTKDKLTLQSLTFSNKIDPMQPLCSYEMTGKCLDSDCPWQHMKDLPMEGEDLLMDLASYHPKFNQPVASSKINDQITSFVEKFGKNVPRVSIHDKCLLMLNTVNSEALRVPPHTIAQQPRSWKVTSGPKTHTAAPTAEGGAIETWKKPSYLESDNIISDEDVRYWMHDSSVDAANMESLLEQEPQNIAIWLKLAYKKMHSADRRVNAQYEAGIDSALNVLSKGLEANPKNCQLWLHYLNTYSKRKGEDVLEMYKCALENAPSYHLYWECDLSEDERSHCMVEVLFHQVRLCLDVGKYKSSQGILQKVLNSKKGKLLTFLTTLNPMDLAIVWLGYAHLLQFKTLPVHHYDSRNSNPSRIVCKDIKALCWRSEEAVTDKDLLSKTLHDAATMCAKKAAQDPSVDLNAVLSPIYLSIIHLQKQLKDLPSAVLTCEAALKEHPSLTDVWLSLAALKVSEPNGSTEVLTRALDAMPHCAHIHLALASYELDQGGFSSMALQYLELAILNLYEDESEIDPYHLYCHLLKLPTPLSFKVPKRKAIATDAVIQAQLPYLWLCYGLLLRLQDEKQQESEIYRSAIATLSSAAHLRIVWRRFLCQEMQGFQGGDLSPVLRLVMECVQAFPSKYSVPFHPSASWIDYSFHNEVLALFLKCAPYDLHADVFNQLLPLMPHNVHLIQSACTYFIQQKDLSYARGICSIALMDHPACLPLHAILLFINQNLDYSYDQMKALFEAALQKLPFHLGLWKDYLSLEIARGTEAGVKRILQTCRKNELHVQPFISSVMGR
ncbi:hypothetical protein CAPTEDRAFT_229300 [Capitella teleta]|uniref:Putative zinc-finger domain-containing protein n=1 Tax=Capitella teleta TaxID=283909 RepID=R7VJG7_CAPTE|nr:hypothetical protein CAPTEDRAFT_229300 [Capitella teleta]|eukprot:ELU18707.1 hypothetical protein CAPTEDRAFT_229300 [Capitella teleta]